MSVLRNRISKISVVIPSKNNGKTIRWTLLSIVKALECLKRVRPNVESEIIVVDAHSTDETRCILEEFSRKGLIKIVYDEGKGPGPARNLGLRVAKGDVVFFVDADCIVEAWHFPKYLRVFEDRGADIVWSLGAFFSSLKRCKIPKIARLLLMHRFADINDTPRIIEDSIYGASALMAVRRDVALNIGGFWDWPFASEDNDFTYRAWRRGYRIIKILTRSISLPRFTMRDLWRQQVWYGAGVICFYMKYRWDSTFWRTRGKDVYTLFKLFGASLSHSLLDVGCGYDFWGFLIKRRVKGIEYVVGFNIDLKRVVEAKPIYDDVVLADAKYPPFRASTFDAVTAIEVLHTFRGKNLINIIDCLIKVSRRVFIATFPRIDSDLYSVLKGTGLKLFRYILRGFLLVSEDEVYARYNTPFLKIVRITLKFIAKVIPSFVKRGYLIVVYKCSI